MKILKIYFYDVITSVQNNLLAVHWQFPYIVEADKTMMFLLFYTLLKTAKDTKYTATSQNVKKIYNGCDNTIIFRYAIQGSCWALVSKFKEFSRTSKGQKQKYLRRFKLIDLSEYFNSSEKN